MEITKDILLQNVVIIEEYVKGKIQKEDCLKIESIIKESKTLQLIVRELEWERDNNIDPQEVYRFSQFSLSSFLNRFLNKEKKDIKGKREKNVVIQDTGFQLHEYVTISSNYTSSKAKMHFKCIISGCLEFGNQRSYDQVLKLFQHRTENYYRNDILLKAEDIFQESSYSIHLPRFISECSERSWKNTSNSLMYVAQYAIAGDIRMWVISKGRLIADQTIEPKGNNSAIQAFMRGRKLVQESGKEEEAMKALNRAIEKFERHGKAYERRGYVNFKLRNYKDAMYDFSKSIEIHPNNPEAYWGRANVKIKKQDLIGAIQDLEMAIKTSIPHQPIFWSARRLKGELYLILGDYQKAIAELKLVTKRLFKENDPNAKWQKNALFNYGKALFEVGEFGEAVKAFNKMFEVDNTLSDESPSKEKQYLNRGLARQKTGESGYLSDIKEEAKLAFKRAQRTVIVEDTYSFYCNTHHLI